MTRLQIQFRCLAWLAALLLTLSAAGCGTPKPPGTSAQEPPKEADASPVEVESARPGSASRILLVTGSLKARQESAVASKRDGRILTVLVREGDAVTAGQILAQLEDHDQQAQVRAAEATVTSAQAQVSQAEAVYRQQVVSTRAAIASAESGLQSARARLSQVRAGARRQEIGQAESAVSIARANYQRAEADYGRYVRLGKAGAVADVDVEQHRAQRDVSAEQLRAAEHALSLLKEGARTQEVDQARQGVRQATESLRQAQAAAAQDAVRLAEITTARAALQQQSNALAVARQALADTLLRAPSSGRVSARAVEPGQVVASGIPLLKVVTARGVYFEPSVPETDLARLQAGQDVAVTVDAMPDRTMAGRVTRLSPAGQVASRAFAVRIDVADPAGLLRPGMFARGRIELERRTGRLMAPMDAVVDHHLFVVDNGRARMVDVKDALASPDGKLIELPGVGVGTQVIVAGHRTLKDGDRVSIRSQATPAPASPGAGRGE